MSIFEKYLQTIPEVKDQVELFQYLAFKEDNLSAHNRKIVAWTAALTLQDKQLVNYVKSELDELSDSEKKLVFTATTRMGITNPYFMARNIHSLQAGGSLAHLQMRPFQDLNIENAIGYHYACITASLVNGGYVCFNSHLTSLKSEGQTDKAIDQALRLVVAVCSIKQVLFNKEWL